MWSQDFSSVIGKPVLFSIKTGKGKREIWQPPYLTALKFSKCGKYVVNDMGMKYLIGSCRWCHVNDFTGQIVNSPIPVI